MKDRRKVERGKRYLKHISAINKMTEPSKATDLKTSSEIAQPGTAPYCKGVQQQTSEASFSRNLPNNENPLVAFKRRSFGWQFNWNSSPDLQRSLNPQVPFSGLETSSGPAWLGANTTNKTQQLAFPTHGHTLNDSICSQISTFQWQPGDWSHELGLGDVSQPQADLMQIFPGSNDFDLEAFSQFPTLNSPSLSVQNPSAEMGIFFRSPTTPASGSAFGQTLSLGFRKEWLRALPSVEFEVFLSGKEMTLKSRSNRASQTSLSGSFASRFVANMLCDSDGTMARRTFSDVQTTFRRLGALLPGDDTPAALISEQQMTESRMIRLLLSSMMNGFAGLNDIPIERLLPCLGRLGFFHTSFLQFLGRAPAHTSRTFVDNLFRAAIEAQDEQTARVLLSRRLVDVNSTICFSSGRRSTPVERAASLHAFKLIRTLVEYGADVDKSYTYPEGQWRPWGFGALECLLIAARYRPLEERRNGTKSQATPTPPLLATVQFLIEKGSKVKLGLLELMADCYTTDEVCSLLSSAIAIAEHREFFSYQLDPGKVGRYDLKTGVVETAKLSHAETSTSIIENMVRICKSHGGACLAEVPDTLERAAIEGAKRGRLKVVELLIDYARSKDRILSAAIRSGNSDLIQLVLSRKPDLDLDAPAHSIGLDSDGSGLMLTTPLAEAVRAGNNEMICLLECCGAFASLKDHGRLEAAIMAAAQAGNVSYLGRLLPIASSTKVKLRIDGEAIALALENDHDEAAHLLLEQGANVRTNFPSSWRYRGCSPLGLALRKRDPKMTAAILATDITAAGHIITNDMEAALEWAEPSVLKSLLFAIPDMDMEVGQKALERFCLHCMETDNRGCLFREFVESTPSLHGHQMNACLATAIRKGHRGMALYMLHVGADPLSREVLAAAIPDRPEMLSLLLGDDAVVKERQQARARAPPKCVGADLLAVLMTKNPGNAAALDKLLDTGAVNLNVPEWIKVRSGSKCLTPLGLALLGIQGHCNTNMDAVRKFLVAGSDPNGTARLDKYPYRCVTGLMVALETGREDVVALMVENGADVNLQPRLSLRRTPLQYAAELGNLDMVRLLIRMGADVNSPSAFQGGGTALQFAAISGNCNIAAELLEQGASLCIHPSKVDGRWPLEGAAEHGRLDMIQLLWHARELSPSNTGFERRQCLRAMDFAQQNGHVGCRDLVAELSGLSVGMLDTEEYGVPWLA